MRIVLVEPFIEIEIVILLGPQHSGERLPVNAALVFAQAGWSDALVKLVRIGETGVEGLIEGVESAKNVGGVGGRLRAQPQAYNFASTGWNVQHVMGGGFGSGLRRIDSITRAGDDIPVKGVFYVR